jgi:eukaryotic-like serine/threonine-protein kinase
MRQSLSRTSFVGRMRELDELNGGLEGALAGHGRLFLISGEPGIGKTRLAEQLATHASERHALVIWGRCWEGSGAPAYWPWIQILRSCVCDQGFSRSDLMPDSEPLLVADLVP